MRATTPTLLVLALLLAGCLDAPASPPAGRSTEAPAAALPSEPLDLLVPATPELVTPTPPMSPSPDAEQGPLRVEVELSSSRGSAASPITAFVTLTNVGDAPVRWASDACPGEIAATVERVETGWSSRLGERHLQCAAPVGEDRNLLAPGASFRRAIDVRGERAPGEYILRPIVRIEQEGGDVSFFVDVRAEARFTWTDERAATPAERPPPPQRLQLRFVPLPNGSYEVVVTLRNDGDASIWRDASCLPQVSVRMDSSGEMRQLLEYDEACGARHPEEVRAGSTREFRLVWNGTVWRHHTGTPLRPGEYDVSATDVWWPDAALEGDGLYAWGDAPRVRWPAPE